MMNQAGFTFKEERNQHQKEDSGFQDKRPRISVQNAKHNLKDIEHRALLPRERHSNM